MSIRKIVREAYWWGLRIFFYNKLNEKLFFSKGFPKNINGSIIRMPFRFSWYYPNEYEVEKTNFINSVCKEGDIVFDIGAHIGVFSFFIANAVGETGRVYSFEPSPFTYNILSQVVQLNNLAGKVKIQNEAVDDKAGKTRFYLYNNSKISNGNSFSSHNTTGNTITIDVDTIDLDSFVKQRKIESLRLIKIDAEGAEINILMGARNVIERFRPYITLEVHPKSFDNREKQMSDLYKLIRSLRYSIVKDKNEMSKETFENHSECFEVLLLPEE